ncbi:MAG: alanine racemase [Melioribacteraceae bacterium]|nr:alanine racemase [Melioribacteraceae bacterium]
MRSTFAEIILSNLRYNFLNIRKKVKKSRVMAVVKADAYGHGMIQCAKSLNLLGRDKPDYYGVALVEEAVELRKGKISGPILSFAPFEKSELPVYRKFNIEPSVSDDKNFRFLQSYKGEKLKIQINIDTGMGRLGLNHDIAGMQIEKMSKNKYLIITGVYTHFATSDEKDKNFARKQISRFNLIINYLKGKNIDIGLVHAANSGAILDLPEAYYDMVRPGISLYGYYPSMETSETIKLKPVMRLVSHVSTVKSISKGESVSYGRLFRAEENTRIATVPIGYADGVVRNLTNRMRGYIKRNLFSQVGRVTMDRIMFDVGGSTVREGDKVILFGDSPRGIPSAWDWCKVLGTIPYEITCGISKRVPRVYY